MLDWNAFSRPHFISYCYCMEGKIFCTYHHQWFWATVYACPKCVFPFLKLWFYNLDKFERILEQLQIFDLLIWSRVWKICYWFLPKSPWLYKPVKTLHMDVFIYFLKFYHCCYHYNTLITKMSSMHIYFEQNATKEPLTCKVKQ